MKHIVWLLAPTCFISSLECTLPKTQTFKYSSRYSVGAIGTSLLVRVFQAAGVGHHPARWQMPHQQPLKKAPNVTTLIRTTFNLTLPYSARFQKIGVDKISTDFTFQNFRSATHTTYNRLLTSNLRVRLKFLPKTALEPYHHCSLAHHPRGHSPIF